MQTLRSFLALFLIAVFVPSPTVWARDILRAGVTPVAVPSAGGGSDGGGVGIVVGREQAIARAQDVLRRTESSIDAVLRMQEAARNGAGIPDPNNPGQFLPDVPDGLADGGLKIADGVIPGSSQWQGAQLPGQHTADGQTVVTVVQDAAQALLTWQSFNVGKNTLLNFDQSAGGANKGNWTVFNQVTDASAAPSQILGQMRADGQVYVINPNGIIFGNNSKVDVRALTASTLPINRHLVENGLLNNPDAQFLFSALPMPSGTNGTPAFTPEPPALGRYGDVLVMAGAQLSSTQSEDGSTQSEDGSGGRIMLVGPNVENHGIIRTPGGQTILAAGLQVGIAAHNSDDASLRGLDIYIGAVSGGGNVDAGYALNSGLIEVMRGNATLAGKTVEVTGAIDSSTSVSLNGRVDLLASYGATSNALTSDNSNNSTYLPFLNSATGTVLIGADSVIRILPELDGTDKVAASELALRSQVNIEGRTVYFGENSTILVPSGIVNVNAGMWEIRAAGNSQVAEFVNTQGQIYLDKNAEISVAGTAGVEIPLSQVLLTIDLRGAELADSPLQRHSVLRGKTITVDIRKKGTYNGVDWVGSPLADVSGYLNLIERTVAELTIDGGDVNLNAGESIVMQQGSQIDVSGGWAEYAAGSVETTRLLQDGRVVDISEALPDLKYEGILDGKAVDQADSSGGTTGMPYPFVPIGYSYQDSYTEGAAGGSLSLTAVAMALDGSLRGSTVVGERQRTNQNDNASLLLAFETQTKITTSNGDVFPIAAPGAPDVVFANTVPAEIEVGPFALNPDGSVPALPQERRDTVTLSSDLLSRDGFGNVTVRNREGDITVGSGVSMVGQRGGKLALEGANVTVEGSITVSGGTIDLAAYNVSYDTINNLAYRPSPVNPAPAAGRGVVSIADGAVLSTAGTLVDDRSVTDTNLLQPYSINGGTVAVRGFETHIEKGSLIDVSGSAYVNGRQKVSYGNGGAIVLEGGRDLSLSSVLGGSLQLGGALQGYSGKGGSSLSLLAPVIQVGGTGAPAQALYLPEEFFNTGGFTDFTIKGIGAAIPGAADQYTAGVTIADGAMIRPSVDKRLSAVVTTGGVSLEKVDLEEGVRPAANVTFGATGAINPYAGLLLVRGEVVLGEGAVVETDAGGKVTFDANGVTLLGSVITPGGEINVRGGSNLNAQSPALDRAQPTVVIGENARLLAQGKTVLIDRGKGIRQGTVHSGGTINVSGNIVAAEGAVLDVSGTSGVLDLAYSKNMIYNGSGDFGLSYKPVRIDSSGGTIILSGSEMLASDATLLGNAGGADAVGGTLQVSSGRFYRDGEISTTADVNLNVIQSGNLLDVSGASLKVGGVVNGADGQPIGRGGHFAADTFANGGFDNLTLGGNVAFTGDVSIEARGNLRVASGGVLQSNGGAVTLKGGHVAIGQNFLPPLDPSQKAILFTKKVPGENDSEYTFAPKHGDGTLRIEAGSIDIGTLSLDGVGNAAFNASQNGAIRGNGFLNIAGDVTLEAGHLYPTTATSFTVTAFDYTRGGSAQQGSVTFNGGNRNLALPYSAGGTLGVYASQIFQNGQLRAPFGTINLGWDGTGTAPVNAISGTSAPVASSVHLGSGSVTSASGVGPDGKGVSLPYGVVLNGIAWIDPRGVDITLGGLPEKQINLSGKNLVTEEGSQIDLRGGGDLFGYRWLPGLGGTKDVLASSGSFAVIPGYSSVVAEQSPYNPNPVSSALSTGDGYANSNLKVGDQVYLSADSGLPAGYYTLLPARYALMEGAYLITPKAGEVRGSNPAVAQADGSHIVYGYRVDGISGSILNGKQLSLFEVASRSVVMQRAEYEIYSANKFLADAAVERDIAVSRLPMDSGQVVFTASEQMDLSGSLNANAVGNGRGSLVDINSALDIVIGNVAGGAGVLALDIDSLNAFSAASLLIGGVRSTKDGVADVTVSSGNVTLDNAGTPLVGSDIILVGKNSVTLAEGARLQATEGSPAAAETVRIGKSGVANSGNGALVRVSSAADARVERIGVATGNTAQLVVGSGAAISGGAVTLDSSSQTSIDPLASLRADHLNLGSGRISLVLDNVSGAGPVDGLILSGDALESILASANGLSLSSYTSIDVYGSGTVGSEDVKQLALNAPSIVAHGTDGGAVVFAAEKMQFENTTGTSATPGVMPSDGSLRIEADTIALGKGLIGIDGFRDTTFSAQKEIRLGDTGGIHAAGNLALVTSLLAAETSAKQSLKAGGNFSLERSANAPQQQTSPSGLGATLGIEGETVAVNSDILLPSGKVDVRARSGDLVIGADGETTIDVGGVVRKFYDKTEISDGGSVTLTADNGSVVIDHGGSVNVSAPAVDSADDGSIAVRAAQGSLVLHGDLVAGGAGSFDLDAALLRNAQTGAVTESLASLDTRLNEGGFSGSRSYRLRSGDVAVDGVAVSRNYAVSADAGAIVVTGRIDASGETGGSIELRAADDVTLENGAYLTAAGNEFSNAGKGGKVFLEAGAPTHGQVNHDAQVAIRSGSVIDLSVAQKNTTSASRGQHSGVLHLRAAQNTAGTDIGVAVIEGAVLGASHIAVEGYKLYDLTGTNGEITKAKQTEIKQDGEAFLGVAGTSSAQYQAMLERISGGNFDLADSIILQAGAEVINRSGDLSLGTATTTATADWDLSSFRFGERSSAGVLTLRASGDIVFHNALSDGFSGGTSLWLAPLADYNAALPANAQSWSYRISAGADTAAADYRRILDGASLSAGKGSVKLGKNAENAIAGTGGANVLTSTAIGRYFQTIRTGSGDIDISAGRDVQLLNPFASVYTAGTVVADPTTIHESGDFVLPRLRNTGAALSQGSLGVLQQNYPVQYAHSGGDVSIRAAGDIGRYTRNTAGDLIADSSRQLPNNWLYRRGYVDDSGNYGRVYIGSVISNITDTDASTSWWVDYSNFFQSVGALGGGNVSLVAGNTIANVDAVVPTNARAPKGKPDASKILELGGGDLLVRAGADIDGGVYYVERGEGTLRAGGEIRTNATRSMNRNIVQSISNPVFEPESTWLPTTLFLGKGSFDVAATGNVLLGPIANTFLLPQGVGNRYWYKTYFNTYAPGSAVSVRSTTGDITLRNEVTMADGSAAQPFLQVWLARQQLLAATGSNNAAYYQPWLRLAETAIEPFSTLLTVLPPSLYATAFSGDVNLSGTYNLFPSAAGQVEILAAGNIHALTANGVSDRIIQGQRVVSWNTVQINLSDANPAFLPGVTNPFSYLPLVGSAAANNNATRADFLQGVNRFFAETGATNSVLQTQQALHASNILHRNDPDPVYLYAAGGDISGLTLYSAKAARIIASRDIADIALYLQNLNEDQISLIAAGRDIVAYHANSERRLQAMAAGNALNTERMPLAGDIQLGGPGALQIFAGRNLDLGVGPGGSNGTFSGVTTIGNRRNPFLPSEGADIIAAAGIGIAEGLASSDIDFAGFIEGFLKPDEDGNIDGLAKRYLNELAWMMDYSGLKNAVWANFSRLDFSGQLLLAREIYQQAKASGSIGKGGLAEPTDPALLAAFTRDYLDPATGGVRADRYLKTLGNMLLAGKVEQTADSEPYFTALQHLTSDGAWASFNGRGAQSQASYALGIFYLTLRDAGRDYNNPDAVTYGTYDNGFKAVSLLFPELEQNAGDEPGIPSRWKGDISLTARQFKTAAGGDISLLAPGGGLVVGFPVASARADQGILTEAGGNINIMALDSIEVGASRIFTLRGGDIAIWSSKGDIAAGSAARTVSSAPPTRVIIDTQTASVQTDLSGLATGGGIGVLQTVKGAAQGDVDLIAPVGAVDAGDAGIRVSGNINVAANEVINADNISSGGNSTGVPSTAAASVPSLASFSDASNSAQAATAGMDSVATASTAAAAGGSLMPSLISVEVLGYGEDDEDDDERKQPKQGAVQAASVDALAGAEQKVTS